MNPNKALWEKGDFTRLAVSMRKSGKSLISGLGITKGLEALDLGCGDGTTALPEALLGADVLEVDIASNLVAAGNRRAHEAGLRVRATTRQRFPSRTCVSPSRNLDDTTVGQQGLPDENLAVDINCRDRSRDASFGLRHPR
jgi:SAM-dependent methyltransferase